MFGKTVNVLLKETLNERNLGLSTNYNPEDEYIVDAERFITFMKLIGFELIESKMFSVYDNGKFRMGVTEKDISFLNRTFIFKRMFDIDKHLKCIHNSQKSDF